MIVNQYALLKDHYLEEGFEEFKPDTITTNVVCLKKGNRVIVPPNFKVIPFNGNPNYEHFDLNTLQPRDILFHNKPMKPKSLLIFEYTNVYEPSIVENFINDFKIEDWCYFDKNTIPVARLEKCSTKKTSYTPEYILFSLEEKDFMVHMDIEISLLSCIYSQAKVFLYLEDLEKYKLHDLIKKHASLIPFGKNLWRIRKI